MKWQPKPIKLRLKLRRKTCDAAWAYINDKSVEIFIQEKGRNAISCLITETQLKKLLGVKE